MVTARGFTRIGGGMLCLGGVVVGAVPVLFRSSLAIVGSLQVLIGLVVAGGMVLCGAVAFTRPGYAVAVGIPGILLSLLSLIGALGGFLIGMLLGIVGGALATAGGYWYRSDDRTGAEPTDSGRERHGPAEGGPNEPASNVRESGREGWDD
jgi:hypothetical protein